MVVFSLVVSYLYWNGLKVAKEFIYNGWLKFIFQYIYYVFETVLVLLILVIGQAVERLAFLSEGMIKISRLESGLIKIDKKKQSINDTVLFAIKDSYVKAKNSNIEITYVENDRGEIEHDSHWTAEAIFNLIDNAIKYGTCGNVVSVSVREIGSSIEIAVEDQNKPIEAKEYNSLFKRFYRGRNSTNIEDAGIGLYITSDIIEKQDGFVSVKTGENGNRFCILMFK